ncbi:type VI secretion system membrane subunit TssM [Marinomonas gallaica]|uniref:type VI secretion system membrane subunit TssM n=1 Tax=Marinomonas gallaica TaxID=1806667 RepID=UPI003A8EB099
MRFMTSFLRLFKGLLWLLALVIVAILIWFVLPMISIGGSTPFGSSMSRIVGIVSMFAMAGAYKLKQYIGRKRNNAAMAKEMTEKPDVPQAAVGEAEVAELKGKFESALEALKKVKTKEGGRGSYLYVLPWYAIIGPSGAGKTTALLNSDLHFPLMDSVGASVKGVGGTRNCDWWFTDEAVLLDTAGRYTTQNNQSELDEAEWKGFLGLLKKFRSRKPINGLIVSFPVDYFLRLPESELIAHAKFIKQRIQEFQETFKIRFPVYIALTKSDLMPGFSEYFDDLGKEDRAQVWGMTFPVSEDQEQDVVPDFLTEYRTLQERIQSRESSRLQAESDVNRRELIYVFPRTLGLLQAPIATFLGEIFKPTRYETQPLLRGVYFTSGTQDGTTLDRVISSLGANFGLKGDTSSHRAGKGKAYFLHNLMTKVIFKESGLAGVNIKQERRMLWMHLAAYGAAALMTLGLSSYWIYSYFDNKQLIAQVEQDIAAAQDEISNISAYDHNLMAPVPALDKVRNITTGYVDKDASRLQSVFQMGLYQGDKLGQEAIEAYKQLLYKSFLPRIMARLEEAMYQERSSADALYETLRVYLMLSDSQHFDADVVSGWFERDWQKSLPNARQQELINRLQEHLSALMEFMPGLPALQPNEELIASARTILSKQPPARRFYAHLKQDGLNNPELGEFRLVDAVGADSIYLFRFNNGQKLTAGINGFYTGTAYQHYFIKQRHILIQDQLTDEWVMGDEYGLSAVGANGDRLFKQVERLYLEDYLSQWRGYIESIAFKPVHSNQESLLLLKRLSRDDSPLIGLLQGIKKHTSAEAFSVLPSESKEGVMSNVSSVLTSINNKAPVEQFERPENPVVTYFKDLNLMVEASEGSALPIDEILKLLDELYVYMSAMDGSLNRGKAAFQNTSDPNGPSAVLREIDVEASRFPQPLAGFIGRVTDNARRLTTTDAKGYMARRWENDVVQQCKAMIEDRYPFDKSSKREATLDDVSAYFGPGGIVESYFDEVMIDYVDTTRRPWQWNTTNGISLGFSDEVLTQLETGRVIRDTFYRNGHPNPNINFELKPISMDKSILRMSLTINGQQMAYAHGPQRGKRFQWPESDGHAERGLARLVIVTSDGQESITEQGDWALFKLFDQAKIRRVDSERYLLDFTLNNTYSISLELRAGSVYNPFLMSELQQVRCQ